MPVYTLGRQFSFKYRGETPDPNGGGGTGNTSLTGVSGMDSDGDGYLDEVDAFWNDPTEWLDTDGDGVGDNTDQFPDDPTETIDTDGDGVGDNADVFPQSPTEWADTDSDGVGDNADLYPLDPTRALTFTVTITGLEDDIKLSDVNQNGTIAFATDTQKILVYNDISGIGQWSEYNSEEI